MIYLIAGRARSGKDTIADILLERPQSIVIHYADALKGFMLYSKPTLWDGEKNAEMRKSFEHFGTELMRSYDKDIWVKHTHNIALALLKEYNNVIIADCRFENELPEYIGQYPTIRIKVERDVEESSSVTENSLPSDDVFDYIIDNNSTIEELRRKICTIIK